jgi:hypothetical protein
VEIDKITLKLIFNAIRTSYKRSSAYTAAINKYLSLKKGPKGGARFDCALCKKPFEKKEIEMDHYPKPVVPLNKRWHQMTVMEYYEHVFCFSVRALCKPCHKAHTKLQKASRESTKEKKKK